MPAPDLYALVIKLVAERDSSLRATQGHLTHAAFLAILNHVDPALAQTLHADHGRKPFTLSPLSGFGAPVEGQLKVRAGQEGWLRVTLLDPTLFHTFIAYFLHSANHPLITLEKTRFHITEILNAPGSHPLCGVASLDDLARRWQALPTPITPYTRISLTFTSPTAFRLSGRGRRAMHVLPDPYFVFGELAGNWDRLTGQTTQAAVRSYAAENVVVARHRLETHMYHYTRSFQVGFTGHATFHILDEEDPPLIAHLNRLADLAFFTGVGSKTTMGMGQVRRSPPTDDS